MVVKIELPEQILEPLFNALGSIKARELNTPEYYALTILKNMVYYELEVMIETEEQRNDREINFKRLFQEHKRKLEYERQIEQQLLERD